MSLGRNHFVSVLALMFFAPGIAQAAPELDVVTFTQPAPGRVTNGDVVIHVSSSEPIQPPSVTLIPGGLDVSRARTQVSGSSFDWEIWVSDLQGTGTLGFVLNYQSIAGESGPSVSTTTDGTVGRFDNEVPVLHVVSLTSDNNDPSQAVDGDQVTLTFESNEPLLGVPTLTLNHKSHVPTKLNATTFQATFTVDSNTDAGHIPFYIHNLVDHAGNRSPTIASTTDGSGVNVQSGLKLVSFISSNAASSNAAKSGDFLTLNFEARDPIHPPLVIVAGSPIPVEGNECHWSAKVQILEHTQGAIPFSIEYETLHGNAAGTVSKTTDGSSVTYDAVAPIMEVASVSGSNAAQTGVATIGETVSLTLVSNEPIHAPLVTMGGLVASVTPATPVQQNEPGIDPDAPQSTTVTTTSWVARIVVNHAVPGCPLSLDVIYADVSGNAGDSFSQTTDESSIFIQQPVNVEPSTWGHIKRLF
ncbi:MAG: hypothetical protein HKN21_04965 [Candidatus Eisenbacteria bacterium]|uniref:Uncharacterized protein n=1 Tax=Eiseniibacteriota bacterium TaxID=2212470 RepID=A0A7Y2E9X0_UNCEI|nr:hypothetical protein [Candidatus Eisenbacteria bacterium]